MASLAAIGFQLALLAGTTSLDARLYVQLRHTGQVHAACLSKNGSRLLTASEDRTARVWDVKSGREALRIDHSRPVHWVSFSEDETRILTADGSPTFGGLSVDLGPQDGADTSLRAGWPSARCILTRRAAHRVGQLQTAACRRRNVRRP